VTLVAVTTTVREDAMEDGAVYMPEVLTLPEPAGVICQATAVLKALDTLAVNCWNCTG
jgi:hypothetical protein